jgi:hypothetical protein
VTTPASQTFRGYRAITEVVERMTALADWFQQYRPDCKVMTLARRDLDLLQRWPKAAAIHHVHTNTATGLTYWRGFELRADKTPPRYDREAANEDHR